MLIIGGMLLLIVMVSDNSSVWAFAPGLYLVGGGLGAVLTASVNVVQCSFVESQQGEISGLSRSVSNLGSSLGVRDRRNRSRRRHRNHPGTVLRAGHGRARGVRRDRVYRGDDAAQDHHHPRRTSTP